MPFFHKAVCSLLTKKGKQILPCKLPSEKNKPTTTCSPDIRAGCCSGNHQAMQATHQRLCISSSSPATYSTRGSLPRQSAGVLPGRAPCSEHNCMRGRPRRPLVQQVCIHKGDILQQTHNSRCAKASCATAKHMCERTCTRLSSPKTPKHPRHDSPSDCKSSVRVSILLQLLFSVRQYRNEDVW